MATGNAKVKYVTVGRLLGGFVKVTEPETGTAQEKLGRIVLKVGGARHGMRPDTLCDVLSACRAATPQEVAEARAFAQRWSAALGKGAGASTSAAGALFNGPDDRAPAGAAQEDSAAE